MQEILFHKIDTEIEKLRHSFEHSYQELKLLTSKSLGMAASYAALATCLSESHEPEVKKPKPVEAQRRATEFHIPNLEGIAKKFQKEAEHKDKPESSRKPPIPKFFNKNEEKSHKPTSPEKKPLQAKEPKSHQEKLVVPRLDLSKPIPEEPEDPRQRKRTSSEIQTAPTGMINQQALVDEHERVNHHNNTDSFDNGSEMTHNTSSNLNNDDHNPSVSEKMHSTRTKNSD